VNTENKNQTTKNMKPEITDYNKFMRGMDRKAQMVHYYPHCRKPIK
jgi:hypothetical protein